MVSSSSRMMWKVPPPQRLSGRSAQRSESHAPRKHRTVHPRTPTERCPGPSVCICLDTHMLCEVYPAAASAVGEAYGLAGEGDRFARCPPRQSYAGASDIWLDPSGLLNSNLEGKARRAIDFRKGDNVNEKARKRLFAPPWPRTRPRPQMAERILPQLAMGSGRTSQV
jgi:hypothetical protein